jgi:hypothetical protein
MPYTLLRQGDRLPTVAVVQILLGWQLVRGSMLNVDGVFGPRTKAAVIEFQRRHPIDRDGAVGRQTWPLLLKDTGLDVIDAVDVTDPDLMDTEAADLTQAGGRPIVTGGMSNGVAQVVQDIRRRNSTVGSVVLLRFFGHGAAGTMAVSDGVGFVRLGRRRVYLEPAEQTSLDAANIGLMTPILAQLRPIFAEFASVELHGCKVAGSLSGRQMIQKLADIWHVPVTAARRTQLAGGSATFRFEGPVHTAFPGGGTLRSWSRRAEVAAAAVLVG